MATKKITSAQFRHKLFSDFKSIITPTVMNNCSCWDCVNSDPDDYVGAIPLGWRGLLEDLLHDLNLLYRPENGVWKLKHQGIYFNTNGIGMDIIVQNTTNKKQAFKTKTHAHTLLKEINKRVLKTCVQCGKPSVKTKTIWYDNYPVCKLHTKLKQINY